MKYFQWLWLGLFLFACNRQAETYTPNFISLTESVYASGMVKAVGQYEVHAPVSGIVGAVFNQEGERVKKGAPLFRIKGENSVLQKANAKVNLDLARQKFDENAPARRELELRVATAQEQFLLDSINYFRKKRLYAKEVGTLRDLEQAQLAFSAAQNSLNAARRQLEALILELDANLKQASNQYFMYENTEEDFWVKSQLAGKVYAVHKEPGEWTTPQEALAVVGHADSFLIELQVDELDIGKIFQGQEVYLSFDTYPDSLYVGIIAKIFPLLDERTQTFRVEASFQKAPQTLYPALSVEANILVRTKERAMVIPKNYLFNGNKVLDQEGNTLPVEIGLSNLEYAEILSGLDTNTVLVKPE